MCSVSVSATLAACSTHHGTDHTMSASTSKTLPCGAVPARQFRDLVGLLHSIVSKRKEEASKSKGTSNGYHHTPAFIHAVLLEAQVQLAQQRHSAGASADQPQSTSMPRGGFTDVGQHMGTLHPNTAWPLVREALKVRDALGQMLHQHVSLCLAHSWRGCFLCWLLPCTLLPQHAGPGWG